MKMTDYLLVTKANTLSGWPNTFRGIVQVMVLQRCSYLFSMFAGPGIRTSIQLATNLVRQRTLFRKAG